MARKVLVGPQQVRSIHENDASIHFLAEHSISSD